MRVRTTVLALAGLGAVYARRLRKPILSEDGNWVWTFVLEARDGSTRLISRNRFRLPTLVVRLGMLPMEPASLVMERKMLRGIKQRAERLSSRGD